MNNTNSFESKELITLLNGDPELESQINIIYDTSKEDYSSQVKRFKKMWYKAYRFNEPESYYVLSFYYLFGIGVEKDAGKSIASLKRAANLRHIPSLLLLAKLYLFGVYLKHDENKAIEYLGKLLKFIDDEETDKYINHILLLVYLYQKQDETKNKAFSLIIKYKLIDKVIESKEIEVISIRFEIPEEFKEELNNQLSRIQQINKIKTKISKDNYDAIEELLNILNKDVPEDNYDALVGVYKSIKNCKTEKSKSQYKETVIKIINCITNFKVYIGENE